MKGYRDIKSCEDYDFFIRTVIEGYKLGVIQTPLLKYRINVCGISLSTRPLQKTSHYIIREYYRKEISTDEYNDFMQSKKDQKKQDKYRRYYKISLHLKTIESNRIKYITYGLFIFFSSSEVREAIYNILIGKLIR